VVVGSTGSDISSSPRDSGVVAFGQRQDLWCSARVSDPAGVPDRRFTHSADRPVQSVSERVIGHIGKSLRVLELRTEGDRAGSRDLRPTQKKTRLTCLF
jgi:hypothetical protein